jgi:hypothetical protein
LAWDKRLKTGDLNEGYSGDCIGKSVALRYVVGGHEHINDMNHCIFTPLKGVLRFQINLDDVSAMLHMSQSVIAELDLPRVCEDCGQKRTSAHWHFIVAADDRTRCAECHYRRKYAVAV